MAVVLIIIGYYGFFRTSAVATQYALATVQKGTVVSSISGTGQVSASNQVDIKPKVTGTVTYVAPLTPGQKVGAGTLIALIDSKDAQKAVRNAQLNLQVAQLSLAKLQNDQVNSQISTSDTLTNTQDALTKAYQDGFNAVATSFIHSPSALNDARLALYGTQLTSYGCQPDYCAYDNLIDQADRQSFDFLVAGAQKDYATASASYNLSLENYKNTSHTADPVAIELLIDQTLGASQDLSQVMKSESTMLSTLVSDIQKQTGRSVPTAVTAYQTTILSDLSTINSQVSTLLSIQSTITNSKQTLASSQRSITSNTQGNSISLQSQQNTIAQSEATLSDAQTTLADYSIRAPFAGILAALPVKLGDSASSATAMATVISPQEVVEISLNEVDVSKIAVGQQATFTFDAIPSLTLTGKVVSMDTIGTVTQGVVSYNIKVAFDTNNDQVKPGMSVSAAIIIQAKPDVLEVPSGAVKTQGGQSYVQVVQVPATLISSGTATVPATALASAPQNQPVTVGISSDTMTEITSGLNQGDVVVVRTITGAAATTTSSSSSLRIPGLTGGASGGAGRATTTVPGR